MHVPALDHIKVLRVTPNGQTGAVVIDETTLGPRPRHFAKKLTGSHDAFFETGYLHDLYPAHAVRFLPNGNDNYPIDPRMPFWRLPGIDFKIWGTGLIFKFRSNTPIDHELDMAKLMEDFQQANPPGPRKSAVLRLV